jgi:phosphatidylserine/phosphatidylglycerophosphate/cardiolipin synthase-like enzyme
MAKGALVNFHGSGHMTKNVRILRWAHEIRDAVKKALDIRRKPYKVRIVSLSVKDVLLDGKSKHSLKRKLALLLSADTLVTILIGNSPYRFDNIVTKVKSKYKKKEDVEKEVKRYEELKKAELEFYKDLMARGAKIYHNRRVHAKMILVETNSQRIVLIMSSNLTDRGLRRNYEVGIYIPNAEENFFRELDSYVTHVLTGVPSTQPLS